MKIGVAITGASGAILGRRLLEELWPHEVHLIVSENAKKVIRYELGEVELPAARRYNENDIDASIASSSSDIEGMVIVPCSMKTLSAVANGYANNLIVRVAENMLRVGRRLVVVPRETPLSLSGIENMRKVKLGGGIILPPVMAYYYDPKTIDEVTNFFISKILDCLGIDNQLCRRWQECELKGIHQEDRGIPGFISY